MNKIVFGTNKNIIHENLKELRIKSGLTQGQLAAKMQTDGVNIDQQMISKIERNERLVTDYELISICKNLAITEKELLFGHK